MVDQLNRFMALLVLFGLLTRPVMAAPDGYQTLGVDGDTLVVQMAEPLPTGYQTLVVDGDTLTVQVLAESLPTDDPPLAASDDSLSVQTKAMETSPQAAVGDNANTKEGADRHLLNSVFMGDPFRSASAVSDSTERMGRRGINQVLAMFGGAALGGLGGTMIGFATVKALVDDCPEQDGLCVLPLLGLIELCIGAGAIIGMALASDPPDQAEPPSKPDETRRFSVGLVPDTRGRLSAVAVLRF